MRKRPLLILFSIITVDLIGFGVVMPILPFYAKQFGANATVLGLLLTVFSAMQFCFAPVWGRLSDRIGRKKVLVVTLLAGSAALVILGWAPSLLWLFIGRTLSGIFAANVSVASAYVSDVTSAADRAKGMGLIGAAFGIGFLLGPLLGGMLAPYGYAIPILVAAALTAINAVHAAWRLPEPSHHLHAAHESVTATFEHHPGQVRRLVLMNFFYIAGVAQLETVLPFLLMDRYRYDAYHTGLIFGMMAAVMVAVQGGLIRVLLKQWEERRLLAIGVVLLVATLATIPMLSSILLLLIVLAIASLGRGLSQPALLSLVSKAALPAERGAVMGAFQSAASLARVAAPVAAGVLYDWRPPLVFLVSAGLVAVLFAFSFASNKAVDKLLLLRPK